MDSLTEEINRISLDHAVGDKAAGRQAVNLDCLINEFNNQLTLVSIPDDNDFATDKIEIPINDDTWHPHNFDSVASAARAYRDILIFADTYAHRLREWLQRQDGNKRPHHIELLSQILLSLSLKRMEAMAIVHFSQERADKYGPAAETPFAAQRLLSLLERVNKGRDCAKRMYRGCVELWHLIAEFDHDLDSKQFDDLLKEMIRVRDGANGPREAAWLRDWYFEEDIYLGI
jgi:hypothetical protein